MKLKLLTLLLPVALSGCQLTPPVTEEKPEKAFEPKPIPLIEGDIYEMCGKFGMTYKMDNISSPYYVVNKVFDFEMVRVKGIGEAYRYSDLAFVPSAVDINKSWEKEGRGKVFLSSSKYPDIELHDVVNIKGVVEEFDRMDCTFTLSKRYPIFVEKIGKWDDLKKD
ncbi:hypothetical protein [Vibrio sp. 10N.261.46.A3]|uniref:hypothetical protein n=1 Tax=Vibrio sp. 10N.261.46.A3 TaxID=3229658 RepID=UPI00354D889B